MSVEVAALSAPPTRTTTETPGSGSRPLVMRPSTRQTGPACGVDGFWPPADAPTTPAIARASADQRRVFFKGLTAIQVGLNCLTFEYACPRTRISLANLYGIQRREGQDGREGQD